MTLTVHSKKCFKCENIKPLSGFYRHAKMSDGYLNKCIECAKNDAVVTRNKRRDYYLEYDRQRTRLPHRVADRAEYRRSGRGQQIMRKSKDDWALKNKHKRAAHFAVQLAIKNGLIKKQPCEVCGSDIRIHGHHDDYAKPLVVRWLCQKHHFEVHRERGDFRRGRAS